MRYYILLVILGCLILFGPGAMRAQNSPGRVDANVFKLPDGRYVSPRNTEFWNKVFTMNFQGPYGIVKVAVLYDSKKNVIGYRVTVIKDGKTTTWDAYGEVGKDWTIYRSNSPELPVSLLGVFSLTLSGLLVRAREKLSRSVATVKHLHQDAQA